MGQYVAKDSDAIDVVTKAETMVATKGGMGQYVAKGNDAVDGVLREDGDDGDVLAGTPQPPN